MIVARLTDGADYWRTFLLCLDGVLPFVSHCIGYLVPWWWHGIAPLESWRVTP